MNTSAFLTTLRAHSALPLVFKSGDAAIDAGYHLTEVKDVTYRTMDCGAKTDHWTETQFELWVPPSAQESAGRGHMPAVKFLKIVDRVQREIPLDQNSPARIFVSLGDHPASLHAIEGIAVEDDQLVVALETDRTRCKARERSQGGSCGCGDISRTAQPSAVVCCS
jgi:hypothetical protein